MPFLPVLIMALILWSLGTTPAHASRQERGEKAVIHEAADAAQRCEALLRMSTELEKQRPMEALAHRRTALLHARGSGDPAILHRTLEAVRAAELEHGTYENALHAALGALETSRDMGDEPLIADDLRWLGRIYQRMGQMARAVEELGRALVVLGHARDSSARAHVHLDMIQPLIAMRRDKEAMEHRDRAEQAFRALNDQDGLRAVWLRTAEALVAQGKCGDALPFLAKYRTAQRTPTDATEKARMHMAAVKAHIQLKHFGVANAHVDTLEHIVRTTGERGLRLDLLRMRASLSDAEGDAPRALADLKALKAAEDSLLNEGTARQLAGMQALYRLNDKERDNTMLRERNRLNEEVLAAERRRNHSLFALLITSAILLISLITLALLAWLSLRRTKRMNQVIRRQSQELRERHLELERRNARLADALVNEDQKDLLLREIHHRIKNDLEIVNTLLRLEDADLDMDRARTALRSAQQRVRAMAAVHDRLHRSKDIQRVDMRTHLEGLSKDILVALGAMDRSTVLVHTRVNDLPTEALIPLGLLLNEVLTNMVKHGPPEPAPIEVTIELTREPVGHRFAITQSGGDRFVAQGGDARGFGQFLMQAVAEQLDGKLRILHGDGTTHELVFPAERVMKRAC